MKRYRKILLHAGLSKTGSTSIQNHCQRYQTFLQERGIHYPKFSFRGDSFANHSIPLAVSVAASPSHYALGLKKKFGDSVEQMTTSCRAHLEEILSNPRGETLVLSSERIAGFSDDDMQSLRALLEPHTESLRVIAYIRSPESALEAILQERLKAGAVVEPERIAGRVRRRYEALQHNFSDEIEVLNYHKALEQPGGVVGSFLSLLGIPGPDIESMHFSRDNSRLSMESVRLLGAINRRYSKKEQAVHGVSRAEHDLQPLFELPGQPFQIPDFAGSSAEEAVLNETHWLESRLGFSFPRQQRYALRPLWQPPTLDALERAINQLESEKIRQCVAQTLLSEADAIGDARPEQAATLRQIGAGVPAV